MLRLVGRRIRCPIPRPDARPNAHRGATAGLALAGVLWAAGCATGPAAAPDRAAPAPASPSSTDPGWRDEPPPPPDAGRGGPLAALPPVVDRLRALALQEWQLWGQGRWHAATGVTESRTDTLRRHEGEADFSTRVLAYWLSFRGADFAPERFRHADGSLLPWSAVFISWLMRSAGVPERHFAASESHWTYIRDALEAGPRNGFETHDAADTAPQPGDVICAPRPDGTGTGTGTGTSSSTGTGAALAPGTPISLAQWRSLPRAQRQRGWPWHCDLVVQVDRPPAAGPRGGDGAAERSADNAHGTGEAGAIGGNVSESVTWTRAPLDAQGRLVPTAERPWVLLLRHRTAPPGPGPATAPAQQP